MTAITRITNAVENTRLATIRYSDPDDAGYSGPVVVDVGFVPRYVRMCSNDYSSDGGYDYDEWFEGMGEIKGTGGTTTILSINDTTITFQAAPSGSKYIMVMG